MPTANPKTVFGVITAPEPRQVQKIQSEMLFPSRMVLSLRLVFNLGSSEEKPPGKSSFPAFGAGQIPQGINSELEIMGNLCGKKIIKDW